MKLINSDKIQFRCAYNGDCSADLEKCKKCSEYVVDFESIQNMSPGYDIEHVVQSIQAKRRYEVINNRYGEGVGAVDIRHISIDEAVDIVLGGVIE